MRKFSYTVLIPRAAATHIYCVYQISIGLDENYDQGWIKTTLARLSDEGKE